MLIWNEHEARRAAWLERLEQLRLEAEAYRQLKQAKLENPLKTLLRRLWSRWVPSPESVLKAGLYEEPRP